MQGVKAGGKILVLTFVSVVPEEGRSTNSQKGE